MECENVKCNKEHDGSFGSGRFCSVSCSNSRKHSNKTKSKISKTLGGTGIVKEKLENCLNCNKKLTKQYKYCSKQCQKDFQYKEYIKKWKNEEVDGSKSNGMAVSGYVRRYLFEKYEGKCSKCGWGIPNPFINKVFLEVDHINGDSTNNKKENLDLLCPNCHSLTPTYCVLNKGNGNRQRLKYNKLI